jgi:hypothetical protein
VEIVLVVVEQLAQLILVVAEEELVLLQTHQALVVLD